MSDAKDDASLTFEALSVLADGEASDRDLVRACAAWRDDESARQRWRAYHMVGEVMRSDADARPGRRSDAEFLASFRERLAQEPVVLAPSRASLPPADRPAVVAATGNAVAPLHRRRWAGPMSVAAGFVLLLGGVVSALNGGSLSPSLQPGGQGDTMALAPSAGPALGQASLVPADAVLPASEGWSQALNHGLTPDAGVIRTAATPSFNENVREGAGSRVGYLVFMRDDQLDQLMAAQREQAGARSLASPASSAWGRPVAVDVSGR